ncbi:hypothetical protein ACFQ12_19265 [Methylobacterium trifolii]
MQQVNRDLIIVATLIRYRLSDHDHTWARRLIDMPLSEIREQGDSLIDFTSAPRVIAAVIDAREACARAGLCF